MDKRNNITLFLQKYFMELYPESKVNFDQVNLNYFENMQLTDSIKSSLDEKPDVHSDVQKGWNLSSFDFIELIVYVEEEFKIEITDEETEKIITTKDLIDVIENHLSMR